MEDKICHIFHHGLTISIELYLPYPEGATVALLKGNCIQYLLVIVVFVLNRAWLTWQQHQNKGMFPKPPSPPSKDFDWWDLCDCVAAYRQQIEASLLFRCGKLKGHSASVNAMIFSEEGILLISGGRDRTVWLWSLNQGQDCGRKLTEMETAWTPVRGFVLVHMSPDNNRVFSGGAMTGRSSFATPER